MGMKASKAWLLLLSLFLDGTAQEAANNAIHAPMLYVREPFKEVHNEWFQSSISNGLIL
jgi:hypothetical protein